MTGRLTNDGNVGSLDNLSTSNHLPVGGQEWVDLFVREMMCASSMDDAKARAARLLEILEESISSRAGEATKTLHKVSTYNSGISFYFLYETRDRS